MEEEYDKAAEIKALVKDTQFGYLVAGILGDLTKGTREEERGQLQKDLGRTGSIRKGISQEEVDHMARYFRQDMLSLATFVLMAQSSARLSLGSLNQNVQFEIFRETEKDPPTLRVLITDPDITVNKAPHDLDAGKFAFVAKIPGLITIDYIFHPNGFELKDLTFNNAVLEKLFTQKSPDPESDPNFYTPKNFEKLGISARRLLPEPKSPTFWNMNRLNQKELLKLAGKEAKGLEEDILKPITTRNTHIPFEQSMLSSDIGEGSHVAYDQRQISHYDLLEMSAYYTQAMLGIVGDVINAKTHGQVLFSNKAQVQISRNKDGQIELSAIFQNPIFALPDALTHSGVPCKKSIPGLIMINYTFEFGKGFTLNNISMTKTLHKFITDPPQNPIEEDLDDLIDDAARETPVVPPKISSNRSSVRGLSFSPEFPTRSTDARMTDLGKIQFSNFQYEEMSKLERYLNAPLIPEYLINTNSKGRIAIDPHCVSEGFVTKENGSIILRLTLKNPVFMTETAGITIPGTIITEYHFKPGKGFEPKEMLCSNDILYGLLTNPLKNPSKADFKRLEIEAHKAEATPHALRRSPSK